MIGHSTVRKSLQEFPMSKSIRVAVMAASAFHHGVAVFTIAKAYSAGRRI
jgi:hypothetical protein